MPRAAVVSRTLDPAMSNPHVGAKWWVRVTGAFPCNRPLTLVRVATELLDRRQAPAGVELSQHSGPGPSSLKLAEASFRWGEGRRLARNPPSLSLY